MNPNLAIPWKSRPRPEEREQFLQQVKARLQCELLEHAQAGARDASTAGLIVDQAFTVLNQYLAAGDPIWNVETFLRRLIDEQIATSQAHSPSEAEREQTNPVVCPVANTATRQRQQRTREAEERLFVAAQVKDAPEALNTAFSEYVHLTQSQLIRKAHAITGSLPAAQDAVQEAYAALYKHLRVGGGDGLASIGAWVMRVTMNRAVDHCRRAKRAEESPLDAASEQDLARDDDSRESRPERLAEAWKRLDALPAQQRDVFLMRVRDGLGYGIIGQRLDITAQTARSHYCKAMAKLRAHEGRNLHVD